jgi:RNA 2',3'-cyclic 3'-phosphodiesterase
MTSERPMRLFVAIELPPSWLGGLGELQSRMQAALQADTQLRDTKVRWVKPDSIHLTLKFIGEVAPDRLEAIKGQLAGAVPDSPNIALSFWRAGSFSDRRSPRVIWAGIDSPQREELYALAASIETWLGAAGVPRERRAFTPHLTLARLPQELPDAIRTRVAEVTTAVQAPEITPFVVHSVSLIQSHLGPGGARYERLMAYPISALQPPPPTDMIR